MNLVLMSLNISDPSLSGFWGRMGTSFALAVHTLRNLKNRKRSFPLTLYYEYTKMPLTIIKQKSGLMVKFFTHKNMKI